MREKNVHVLCVVNDKNRLEGIVHWQDCIRSGLQKKHGFKV